MRASFMLPIVYLLATASGCAAPPGEDAESAEGAIGGEPDAALARPAGPTKPGKIALVQYTADLHFGEKERIREELTRFFDEAVTAGANMVVFPEGSSLGYEEHPGEDVTKEDRTRTWCAPEVKELAERFRKDIFCVDPKDVAEAIPGGATTTYWEQKAKDAGVWLVQPTLEKIEGDGKTRYANTAVIFSPKGFLAKHRKSRRWQNEEYLDTVVGEAPTVIDTPFGRFGVIVCNEIFGDMASKYIAAEVNGVIFPSDWVEKSFGGSHGPDAANSFRFASTWKKVNLFAADDHGSSRTGFFPVDENVQEVKMPDERRDGVLVLDVDFSNPSIVTGSKTLF